MSVQSLCCEVTTDLSLCEVQFGRMSRVERIIQVWIPSKEDASLLAHAALSSQI